MLVASHDGLDEISVSAGTVCFHKQGSSMRRFEFDPKDFGIYCRPRGDQRARPATNARIMKETLLGRHPELVDMVAINAAFALMAANVEDRPVSAFLLAGR